MLALRSLIQLFLLLTVISTSEIASVIAGSDATQMAPALRSGWLGWELASIGRYPHTCRDCIKGQLDCGRVSGLVYSRETTMPESNSYPTTSEAGKQVLVRPHDSGSQANETVDGLDATTESLRHAAEDIPSGTGAGDIEKTPVFDRAGAAPKIWGRVSW